MPARHSTVLAALFATLVLATAAPADAAAGPEPGHAAAGPAHARRAAKGSALETFRKRHEAVLRLVHKRATSAKIQREVDALLDYRWIAQAALGGAARYEKRCAPRCEEFEALLTKLIRENYLKRIRLADKGELEYLGEQRRPRAAKVNTRVAFEKDGRTQSIRIDYVMHQVDGRWQVRDIITDGVSLARNYKYEFNRILRDEGGIDALITRLQTKLDELAKAP